MREVWCPVHPRECGESRFPLQELLTIAEVFIVLMRLDDIPDDLHCSFSAQLSRTFVFSHRRRQRDDEKSDLPDSSL